MQSIKDFERTFESSGDLSAGQYHIVKQASDGQIALCSAATDKIIGVLQDAPDAEGKPAVVRFLGTTKVVAGGTIAVGADITTNADGEAIATTTDTNRVLGTYLGNAAAADGDIIEVLLHIGTLAG